MVQPPPPPKRQKSAAEPWIIGCAIGCGALILLGAIVVGVGFFYARKAYHETMAQVREELPGEVAKEYAKLKDDGKVPPENEALFDEIFQATQRPDASPYTILMGGAVINLFLEDGKVDKTELNASERVRDFLKTNPNPGFMETMQFIGSDPDLQRAFQEFQTKEHVQLPGESSPKTGSDNEEKPPQPKVTAPQPAQPPAGDSAPNQAGAAKPI